MNAKELKEFKVELERMSFVEIKGKYEEIQRVYTMTQENVLQLAQELVDLDFDNKYYVDKSKNLMNDLNFTKSYLRDYDHDMKIIKPIMDKKELVVLDQTKFDDYIKNNADVKILIQKVNEMKKEFWDNGHSNTVRIRDKEFEGGWRTVTTVYNEMETEGIFNDLLIQTIIILESTVGNITQIGYIKSNGNRGLDGRFTGDKGTVIVNTILAGGYNIQCLHYRMLVTRINH